MEVKANEAFDVYRELLVQRATDGEHGLTSAGTLRVAYRVSTFGIWTMVSLVAYW